MHFNYFNEFDCCVSSDFILLFISSKSGETELCLLDESTKSAQALVSMFN